MFLLGREISPYTHYDIVAGLFDTDGLAKKTEIAMTFYFVGYTLCSLPAFSV